MIDWQERVTRPRAFCCRSGRAIAPGEVFFSALRIEQDLFVRYDFSQEAWREEDHAGCVSWWKQQHPSDDRRPRPIADPEVLLTMFQDLATSPERPQQCFAWVLALLLVRLKRFRFVGLEHPQPGISAMLLEERASGSMQRIRDPGLSDAEEAEVERNLRQVLVNPQAAAAGG